MVRAICPLFKLSSRLSVWAKSAMDKESASVEAVDVVAGCVLCSAEVNGMPTFPVY